MRYDKTLHTFGDSHASKEHGSWDSSKMNLPIEIKANWLGPKLMYSFGLDNKTLFSHNTVSEGDIVVFCFGEIDCRCHVGKYAPNWRENIDLLVSNYFSSIQRTVKQYDDLTVAINSVVPPIEREHPRNLWMLPYLKHTPSIGTDLDRVEYTKYMNLRLAEYCLRYDYVFIDTYKDYSDDNGFLIEELSDKNCHIANPIYVSNFIIEKILGEKNEL